MHGLQTSNSEWATVCSGGCPAIQRACAGRVSGTAAAERRHVERLYLGGSEAGGHLTELLGEVRADASRNFHKRTQHSGTHCSSCTLVFGSGSSIFDRLSAFALRSSDVNLSFFLKAFRFSSLRN